MVSENQIIQIPGYGGHITDAVIATLSKHYKALNVERGENSTLDISDLSDEDAKRLMLDIEFYINNPQLALENICSNVNNYNPKTDSQKEVLEYAKKLVDINDPSARAGLWVYGNAGIGKSHIAVALAKEFMNRGMEARFYFAHNLNYDDLNNLGSNQAWVIDDLNTGYDSPGSIFKEIVLNAHNVGGRLLVTSNKNYKEFMEELFPNWANQAEKISYLDRTQGMFKIIEMTGKSQRKVQAWYNQK